MRGVKKLCLIGQQFGQLLVIAPAPNVCINFKTHTSWLCKCSCGNAIETRTAGLRSGNRTHCGCLRGANVAKGKTTHGESSGKNKIGSLRYRMFKAAAARAKAKGLDFTIKLKDIIVPDVCPVFGLPLIKQTKIAGHCSPSLDRIDNSKGYVPGNVAVISKKANTTKNAATLAELEQLVAWLRKVANTETKLE